MRFLCDQCKAKYQIADEKVVGKTVRMKCRKCGHQIEVRAAVTETSVSGAPAPNELDLTMEDPAAPAKPSTIPAAPLGGARASAPVGVRAGNAPLATSLAAARAPKPAQPASKSGDALANAFQRNVHEDGASPGLRELSQNDEWYVAINGVPVGPIRIGEVRRKAATGAVTEDSLVWQEGLDEWQKVRAFAELAEVVREAATSGRTSLISAPPPSPGSAPPAPVQRAPALAPAPPPARPAAPRTAPAAFAPRPVQGATAGAVPGSVPGSPDRGAPLAPRGPAPGAAAMASAVAPATRSNVVAIASRLATAERLEAAPEPDAEAAPPPVAIPTLEPEADGPASASGPAAAAAVHVVAAPDPFAAPPPAAATAASTADVFGAQIPGWSAAAEKAVAAVPAPIVIEAPARKTPPWLIIAMLVLAAAFGITAALAVFLRPAAPVSPVVIQMSASPNAAPVPTGTGGLAGPDSTGGDLSPSPTSSTGKALGPLAMGPAVKGTSTAPAPTTSSTGGALDLGGLGEGRTQLADDPNSASAAPRAPGQCLSEAQVMSVINIHQAGVRRVCWEQSPSTKTSVNVSVSMTIGNGGNVEAASAGGDDNSVASCVAAQVRRWSFPAMGCQQRTAFGYHFIR